MFVLALSLYNTWNRGVFLLCKITNLLIYRKKEAFAYKKVDDVKLSDAKIFLIKLQRDGRGYSSIHSIRGVLRPAFQMAVDDVLWSSIFVTLMANKIGGLQFGIYRNCQISSRVFHTAVAALPLTKANRSDFE